DERRILTDTVVNGCAIVRVTVADRDAGYKVFRVLNDRGKEPNAHDIIKTEVFERAGFSVAEADKQSRRWAEHEALLGGSAFDDLLRQMRFIHDKSNRGDLVSGFRKAPLGKIPPLKFLEGTLPDYVHAYDRVARADFTGSPDAEKIQDRLYQLQYLDHQTWRAPAIHFLAMRGHDSEDALDFFKGLERLGYMLQLIVPNRDQRNRRYRKVIETIDARGRDNFYGRGGSLAVTKEDGKRVHDRLKGRFATFTQRRALVLRLNAAMEGGRTIPPGADATVEHVLPRNPGKDSHWTKVWPDEEQRRNLCDAIGNLVLLPRSINEKADTLTFQEKKKLYFGDEGKAHFALTQDLEEEHTWTPRGVEHRSGRLADILCRDWGYDK
ncbi:MAG: HNH endonuclease family protein, partial [Pseudomonadota bacterium]